MRQNLPYLKHILDEINFLLKETETISYEKFDRRKKKCFNSIIGKKRAVGLNTFYIYRTTDSCPTKGVDLKGLKLDEKLKDWTGFNEEENKDE